MMFRNKRVSFLSFGFEKKKLLGGF